MNRPYTICYMIMSADGRIDCPMTENLPGVEEYYPLLDSLDCPNHISGKITSKLEIASGEFKDFSNENIGEECFYDAGNGGDGFEIIIDSKGSLCYEKGANFLIITTKEADRNYIRYLKENKISYIVVGDGEVDLKRASEILFDEFKIKRMAVVGGGHINAAFLKDGLLDEIILLIGAGIDGRKSMVSVFDGLNMDMPLTKLKLKEIKSFASDAVMIRYSVLNKGKQDENNK